MVEVPAFGRVADVCCVQQQGEGFGLVNAAKQSREINEKSLAKRIFWVVRSSTYNPAITAVQSNVFSHNHGSHQGDLWNLHFVIALIKLQGSEETFQTNLRPL